MKYRADIDGLRAIAVAPVILFHAGLGIFSGGYVGVDIFFVISGYLITGILIDEIGKGEFSLLNFYNRRVRRIFPALFVTLLLSLPFALLWMTPEQLIDFGQSLIAVLFFVSNGLFWLESDYFASAADEKPMLHTWSLAVEEQYYIFFPILLFLIWRMGKGRVLLIFTALGALSLGLTEWGWRNHPDANFYLAPFRAWELLVGAACALIGDVRIGRKLAEALCWLGFALFAIAIFTFDDATPFPSLNALAPVTGAALIILFGRDAPIARSLLSARPVVPLGLISYSAYLFHLPLFVFARIKVVGEPGVPLLLMLSVVSVAAAYVSWRFIERPFRDRKRMAFKNILIVTLGCYLAIGASAVAALATNGFENFKYTAEQRAILETATASPKRGACHPVGREAIAPEKACVYFSGEPRWAVFGNSHGVELSYALAEKLKDKNLALRQFTISRCRPAFQLENGGYCADWMNDIVAFIGKNPQIENVVLSFKNYDTTDLQWTAFHDLVSALLIADKKVFVVLQAPMIDERIEYYAMHAQPGARTIAGTSRAAWRMKYRAVYDRLAELPAGAIIIDPADQFCSGEACFAVRDGAALYFDNHHMSVGGAGLVAEEILARSGVE